MVVNGQIIEQSFVVTSAWPLIVVTAVTYLLLILLVIMLSIRTPEAPFTLAGVLTMHSKLVGLGLARTNVGQTKYL